MSLRVTALIAAHNEVDVIAWVVKDLVDQGIRVHLLDHASTDGTSEEARRHDREGLVAVERFPPEGQIALDGGNRFALTSLMKRKEELASALESDWFINADADEFRESPWPGRSLMEGITAVDALGFNAIDFALLDFWPTHDRFNPGDDVRAAFNHFEWGQALNRRQVRCWKRTRERVQLQPTAGHEAGFADRRVFPLKFLLRHYPLRGQAHAQRKIFRERLPRFDASERSRGWHIQYDSMEPGESVLRDPATLEPFDPERVRLDLLIRFPFAREQALAVEAAAVRDELIQERALVRSLQAELDQQVLYAQALSAEITSLQGALASERQSGTEIRAISAARERLVSELQVDLARRDARLADLLWSRSWRWMAPVRATLRMVTGK